MKTEADKQETKMRITIILRNAPDGTQELELHNVAESYIDADWVSVKDGDDIVWKIPAVNVAYMKTWVENK